MLSNEFLSDFKRETEAKWRDRSPNPNLYGFQFQQGTRWNAGLSDRQIAEYESVLKASFPDDFRVFLQAMNGTDLPTINLYGSSGEPRRESVGVYSYPKNLPLILERLEAVEAFRSQLKHTLRQEGFELPDRARLAPIYAHRFVVCEPGLRTSVVLSVADRYDAIVYGSSLQEYLLREFLPGSL